MKNQADSGQTLQQGLSGAGSPCLDPSRDVEAEGYLLASDVAGKLSNPFAKCDAMEKLGLVTRNALGSEP